MGWPVPSPGQPPSWRLLFSSKTDDPVAKWIGIVLGVLLSLVFVAVVSARRRSPPRAPQAAPASAARDLGVR